MVEEDECGRCHPGYVCGKADEPIAVGVRECVCVFCLRP